MRARLYTIAFVAVLVLLATLFTAWYVYYRMPGRVRHAGYVPANTEAVVEVQFYRIQRYISGLAPGFTKYIAGIPRLTSAQAGPIRFDWFHALPYEITFFSGEKAGDYDALLFVNDKPDGDQFANVINSSDFFRALRIIDWRGRLTREKERVLLARGAISVPQQALETARAYWPHGTPAAPKLDESHLFEIAVDNSNGALMKLHGAAMDAYGLWGGNELHTALSKCWPAIGSVSITGELAKNDLLRFSIHIRRGTAGDQASVEQAATALAEAINDTMQRLANIHFAGAGAWTPDGVWQGEYRLSGFEAPLRRALGND